MKQLISIIFLFTSIALLPLVCHAQFNSDCEDAVSVCNAEYTESNSPSGTGNVFEAAPGSCQTGGEFNSAWYVFSPQTSGPLSFVLEPNSQFDDYDWSLFDITTNGCDGINTGASPEISCNSYGSFDAIQGPTGISSAQGGFGSVNGPGDTNGPPFNGDLTVTAGNVYALVVMNFSSTLNGYNLDFGTSEADIFDATAPTIESISIDCESSTVEYFFSENVVITDAQNSDFNLLLDGTTTLTPTSFSSDNTTLSNHITATFANVLEAGTYQTIPEATSPLADVCGNEWQNIIDFTVLPLAEYTVTTNPACNGFGGSVELNITNSADANFTITFNGNTTTETQFTDVEAGSYNLIIANDNGCEVSETVVVSNLALTVNAGQDQELCDMQTTLSATHTGTAFTWMANPNIQYTNPTSVSTHVQATQPGTYILECSSSIGNCSVTDAVSVFFAYPPQIDLATTPTTCFGYCDGTLQITNSNPNSLTVFVAGKTLSGEEVLFNDLCSGSYSVDVIHSPGCTSSYSIEISSPAEVTAAFNADKWVVSTSDPSLILTSSSINADSIHWEISGYEELVSSEIEWPLTLPNKMGFYTVVLTAFDSNGCSSQVDAQIEVRDEFRFYVANSFTPNGDDINDVFRPEFSYPPVKYVFTIFNRYGEPIFMSTDYKEYWTGEVRGGEYYAPNGVYQWMLKVRGAEVDEQTHQGHLTIIR